MKLHSRYFIYTVTVQAKQYSPNDFLKRVRHEKAYRMFMKILIQARFAEIRKYI